MAVGMGLNLLLLLAMVAANILSFYHLSSIRSLTPSSIPSSSPASSSADGVPDHLLRQLHTIRATITHLTRLQHHAAAATSTSSASSITSDLLLFAQLGPIASSCSDHPDLLHRYMNYTPFSPCPRDHSSVVEPLLLRGCHPLPRRRCFSPAPSPSPSKPLPRSHDFFPTSLPDSAVLWPLTSSCKSFSCLPSNLGFDMLVESTRFLSSKSALDLSLPQLLTISRAAPGAAPIKLALDVGGGTGTLAARLKLMANATVLTTTMNLGAPYSEAAALRGLVPLHAPLQQRFPVPDGAVDLVRTGHAVNRWIPAAAMEFLMFDVDRVLRGGGLFWVDHFFCRGPDLEGFYGPMIGRLGYKRIKWAVGNKTDAGGLKYGEVYLTALLQKPVSR